jgi:hypothetical protein
MKRNAKGARKRHVKMLKEIEDLSETRLDYLENKTSVKLRGGN